MAIITLFLYKIRQSTSTLMAIRTSSAQPSLIWDMDSMVITTKYKLIILQIIGYSIAMAWEIATRIQLKIITIMQILPGKINKEIVFSMLEEDNLNK
jgi:hypothetical protein